MYSVLVTTMMSLGTTTPAADWYGGAGCTGRYGTTSSSSWFGGAGCTGCYGGTSSNSWFGSGFLGLGLFSRYGNGSCQGCRGSSVGSYSVPMTYGAGCSSCAAAAMPAMPMMPGSTFAPPTGFPGMPGGAFLPPGTMPGMPGMPGETFPPSAGLGETSAPPTALGESTAGPNQVSLVVTLPPDARLYAEKQLIPLTGPVRVFVTPSLEPGRTYYYELVIEVERGGQTRRETKTVELQVGKVSRVAFPDPA